LLTRKIRLGMAAYRKRIAHRGIWVEPSLLVEMSIE
jgi:hypothetical protein